MAVAVDKAKLYGGIVPYSQEELEEKVTEMGAELSSPLIPTLALKLGQIN